MSELGTEQNPLRVAIVGAGPSGFYATDALTKSDLHVTVHMIERLPSPYGLVRSGVAPDHAKLKQAIILYDRIAENAPGFQFLGNVTVGRDITTQELRQCYHAVIYTCGAETDRKLGIPGQELLGSHSATAFVGWYNGHPDYRDLEFDLSCKTAVIIGQGNVAADVCRILAKTVDELKTTDIADHALLALSQSRISDIYMIGRRGPAQAKFSSKELKEFGDLADCDPVITPRDLELNEASENELLDPRCTGEKRNVSLLREYALRASTGKSRRCHFSFLQGPVELLGEGRLEKVLMEKNQLSGEPFKQKARGTGERFELDCGILFASIGYHGIAMEGIPFDDWHGVFPNEKGRIIDEGKGVPGLYTAGWIKRGPTGIIGTNRACAVETVATLLEDVAQLSASPPAGGSTSGGTTDGIYQILRERDVRVVSYPEWKKIDAAEIQRGQAVGKPREKFTRVDEMLAILD